MAIKLKTQQFGMSGIQLKRWSCQRDAIPVQCRIPFSIQKALPFLSRRKLTRARLHSTETNPDSATSDPAASTQSKQLINDVAGRLVKSEAFQIPFLAMIGFASVAVLVFASGSDSPLLQCDRTVQDWVVANIPASVCDSLFEKTLSNLFIEFDLIVGTLLLFIHWTGNKPQGQALLGLGSLFFYAGVGSHKYEGMLVYAIKQCFHRPRPQSGFISYSFPSGHVTAAVFLTGALLYVLLPVTLKHLNAKTDPFLHQFVKKLDSALHNKPLFWGISYLCTAAGRVGGNVHWTSDTVAACLLGIYLTSLFHTMHTFLIQDVNSK